MELNAEQRKKKNRSKLKAVEKLAEPSNVAVADLIDTPVINQAHSAGLDAFMTGYSMLNYMNKFTKFRRDICGQTEIVELSEIYQLELRFRNNIYLAGKDYPLVVTKSNFATTSVNHRNKQEKLLKNFNNKKS
jgi:hypothetical protein